MKLHDATNRIFPNAVFSNARAPRMALACVLPLTLVVTPAWTAPPVHTPAATACAAVDREATAARLTRSLTADEQRVVCWLVSQIVNAEDDGDARLEFTESDIERSVGVDARRLDRRRIQQHVRVALASAAAERFELLD